MTKLARKTFLAKIGFSFVFLSIGDALLGKAPKGNATKESVALPEGENPVSESEATASSLGFHHDASKTDFKRYPGRAEPSSKNEFCKHCAQFTQLNTGWGKCSILNQGVVSTKGWCGAWSQKS